MTTIVRGPRPPELEQWLERRRRAGADRFDEVWEGRYVVAPDPHSNHGAVQLELAPLLKAAARRLGLRPALTFNLGRPDDFRIPDAGLLPGPPGVWHATAVLVVEVLSPEDMTFDKLDFYAAHGVRELLVLDWQDRSVRCFALQDGRAERDRSDVLGMSTAEVVAAVDWPPLDDAVR
jgi:Uma2 family endonuclease